ncbi:hypothetical protein [Bradyrhizobium sp. 164]|uniref:hypothetical protein n=1 Tax=Bradyrhizobium sp. 164 TaxID=2782637 RepID=UPI001FF906C9|nr:hypothetical protein [Bradyrhizobium sp. 164]MCK1597951.1 hypothetical protein [Bradyrhizobium sp. 164]
MSDESVIRLDRDLLLRRPELADAFLDGRLGAILHEVAHYAAANASGMVRGHLIIHASSERAAAGFVPDDESAEQLRSDRARWSFAASAGLLAEFYFCGNGRPRRAQGDVAAYQAVFGLAPAEEIIARWKRDHLARVGALTACIATNFERCLNYCRSERFLLGDHHVIPSCMLQPPRWRWLSERLDEAVWTYPVKERRRALEEFLAANACFRGVGIQVV